MSYLHGDKLERIARELSPKARTNRPRTMPLTNAPLREARRRAKRKPKARRRSLYEDLARRIESERKGRG